MKCPQCLSEQDETIKFCRECGARLELTCPECGTAVLPNDKFCGECGFELTAKKRIPAEAGKVVSERKLITALFVDVSNYTTLAERLDPEEVNDLMSHLFGEFRKVIAKYEGIIDKFAGDAVLSLFGVPRAHEDDPIRAIRAASEIHRIVDGLSPQYRERIGQPLLVHIGVNTGLVVTEGIDLEKGTQRVAGDTVNVASRLCSLAKAGETLVGQTTYSQAEASFAFEPLEPVPVKGRTKPVQAYRLLFPQELPHKMKRLSGMQAEFIGRQGEMAKLQEAIARLLNGKGSVVAICGEAGSGKSRLIENFKASLKSAAIQWQEGHAYAYTQNVAYYPFTDLLTRVCQIEESDAPEIIQKKAEQRITALVGDRENVLPYVGGLLGIHYPEVESISPDVWKSRLHQAILVLFSALTQRAPTIICLEDLHWADPSSLELLRSLTAESTYPALFLCTFRPPLNLFPENQLQEMGDSYQEGRLQDFSPAETQRMVASLLSTEVIPPGLEHFLQEKVGGNPFYVEEVINSLIESELLIRLNGSWRFMVSSHEIIIPATIQGVITARLDRLDAATKQLIQEAAVIGSTFYDEVLKRITGLGRAIDLYLNNLVELDLVRVKSTHPDLEYEFKHALIQEVVYNGLLKRDRTNIHLRIGHSLEKFFGERSIESWETLAFHFKRGHSLRKAVDYLKKSGEKSLRRYALDEAQQYYREAFDLLSQEQARTKEENVLLIDLLMEWCLVFYYQGRFPAMTALLLANVGVVESLDDRAKVGAFYSWLGSFAFWQGAKLEDSYRYLHKALELGEQTKNEKVIAYACAFLLKTCAEMGYLQEGTALEKRAREMVRNFPADTYLNMNYYSGKAYINWFSGNKNLLYECAQGLLDYGEEQGSLRCQMGGYLIMAVRHSLDQDMDLAVDWIKKVLAQGDPFHVQFARVELGMFLVQMREFEQAEIHLRQVITDSDKQGTEYLKTFANLFLGVALAARGNLAEGIRLAEGSSQEFRQFQRNIFYGLAEYILGNIYLQMVQRSGKKNFSFYVKNLGFLMKNAPRAGRKAEQHLLKAVEVLRQAGAKGFLGAPCLQLGLLFKLKGRTAEAKKYLSEAITVFQECEFNTYLQRAQELYNSLA